jgi:hypothetical protein
VAKIHFAMGNRRLAVKYLHRGLRLRSGRTDLLMAFFGTIGYRRNPPFPFLSREHPLNKYVGMLTWKLSGETAHKKVVRQMQKARHK